MISLQQLSASGFEFQVNKLKEVLRAIGYEKRMLEAKEWMSIPGCTINYSYWEREYVLSKQDFVDALLQLGIDYTKCSGRKWYQFWLDEFDIKITNAIKKIN